MQSKSDIYRLVVQEEMMFYNLECSILLPDGRRRMNKAMSDEIENCMA